MTTIRTPLTFCPQGVLPKILGTNRVSLPNPYQFSRELSRWNLRQPQVSSCLLTSRNPLQEVDYPYICADVLGSCRYNRIYNEWVLSTVGDIIADVFADVLGAYCKELPETVSNFVRHHAIRCYRKPVAKFHRKSGMHESAFPESRIRHSCGFSANPGIR
jgi:hypothetical protein